MNQSFDFSKLPNLQEVSIGLRWVSGDLLWIHTTLSTVKPATSPSLSVIELDIGGRPPLSTPLHLREQLESDLRIIDEHVVRIEREFVGAVNVTVHRHPGFEVGDTRSIFIHSSRVLQL